MSVSDDETGHHPLTERMRYARQRDDDHHHKDIMTYLLRTNGLSLAETASRSLTSLFSLTDRVSPRLRGFKVSSSQEWCLTLSSMIVLQEWSSSKTSIRKSETSSATGDDIFYDCGEVWIWQSMTNDNACIYRRLNIQLWTRGLLKWIQTKGKFPEWLNTCV